MTPRFLRLTSCVECLCGLVPWFYIPELKQWDGLFYLWQGVETDQLKEELVRSVANIMSC